MNLRNLFIAIAVIAAAIAVLVVLNERDAGAIDCGPEGKPALNGTACIDKEPVMVTEENR